MAHVERHHRKPCARDGCAHRFTRHGKSAKVACTVDGCGCPRWRAATDDRETWRARWRDPAGAEHAKTFARKLDADRFLLSLEDSKLRGAYVDPTAGKVALGEWAERWYKTTAALKPSTRHYYRQLLDGQVLPAFGAVTLAGLDRLAVREWVAGLVESGLGASRVRNAHAVLSQVLGSAVEANRLARNVAAGMRGLPRRPEVEMHFLTAVEVEQLAEVIDPRYRLLVLVGAYTGLRPGELTGLRVKRLDLLRGTVRVAEHLGEVNGRLVWGTPKNHERRTVRLHRFLAEELGAYLAGRPHAPTRWCSPRPRVGRCASTTSGSASSSRPPSAPGCRRRCACMTFATRPRAC
jgi:integrase